jgi:hypothetical protein
MSFWTWLPTEDSEYTYCDVKTGVQHVARRPPEAQIVSRDTRNTATQEQKNNNTRKFDYKVTKE